MRRDAASMHDWKRIFSGPGPRGNDRMLLDRFASRRDGEAFESLVRRHGPMVHGVCRRILVDPHDADDAFQATFLVLILRSGRIADADRLGPWLHGVASRVALKARGRSARRKDRPAGEAFGPTGIDVGRPGPPAELLDVMPMVDLEIASLSAKLRDVVVACLVEGDSAEEAARRLDCPVGTVKSRLARGREALKAGLTRRGVAPSAAIAALGAVAPSAASATLIRSTLALAASSAVPGSLIPLTQGVAAAMISKSSLLAASMIGAVALVGVGLAVPSARPTGPPDPAASVAAVSPSPTAGPPPAQGLPPDEKRADGARVNESLKNFRIVLLAFHLYASEHGRFPAATYSPDGKALLSWRVAILPYLGDEASSNLYKEFRQDEPWDGPHNKTLLGRMPAAFATPHSPTAAGKTRIRGYSGSETMFGGEGTLLNSVTDGLSNTIMLVASKFATDWTRPGEVVFDTIALPGEEASLLYSLDDSMPDRRLISFADGAAFYATPPDAVLLRALITRNGGEVVKRPEPIPTRAAFVDRSTETSPADDSAPSVPLGLTGREVASTLDALKQVGTAVWGFENAHGHLPPAATYSADGKPLLSWRVAILPYLGDDAANLYKEFRQDESWDGPHNKPLIDRIPDVYRISYRPTPKGMTRIRGFGGAMTMFPDPGEPFIAGPGVKVSEVPDGTSNTILCVVASEPTLWTKPGEIAFDRTLTSNPKKLLDSVESSLSDKRLMLITDGRVVDAVPPDATTLRNLITRNGGEVVQLPDSADRLAREQFEAMKRDRERAEPLKVNNENRAPSRPSTEERLDRLESKVDRLIELMEKNAGGKPKD